MSPISMGFRFREMQWRCTVALPADAPASGVGPIPKSSSLLVQEGDTLGWVSSLARGIPSAFNRCVGNHGCQFCHFWAWLRLSLVPIARSHCLEFLGNTELEGRRGSRQNVSTSQDPGHDGTLNAQILH